MTVENEAYTTFTANLDSSLSTAHYSPTIYRIGENGIDAPRPCDKKGFVYEDICMQALTTHYPFATVIGPHLTDVMFGSSSLLSGLGRPDALIFLTEHERWIMYGLGEFRSGKKRKTEKKLTGFATLIDRLRDDTSLIQHLLATHIDSFVLPPETVEIPPTNDTIEVVYMTTEKQAQIYAHGTGFRTGHVFVPFHKADARALAGKSNLKP